MGPLAGVRIVEMSGIGPGPFCGMLLADMGADVIRVDRLAAADLGFDIEIRYDIMNRSKRAIAVDIKSPQGVETVKNLVAKADILIEGFRPGVMERLGLGPEVCLAINPRLVFGRMTGFGQDGPMKNLAGHDINYIAVAGALHAIGHKDGPPLPPLNLVGDFGGGALYLAMGVLAALNEARTSGKGQVVDAAMIDGVASLMAMIIGFRQSGMWQNERGMNPVDGGAPYYTTYKTRDGKYMAVGAIEKRFYAELLAKLGLDPKALPDQDDRTRWDELRAHFTLTFASKTRDEWEAIFANGDACVSPILDMDECPTHPLSMARGMYTTVEGVVGPSPAPRFSRTKSKIMGPPVDARKDTRGALQAWGFSDDEISTLAAAKAIAS
ncbi:MAG: carnitine dehydratase [Rhizobiales bacterium PAR1]|nr:MAG: carnitine dehydratase [Rhizobiales bacterium PAR1]